MLIKICGIKTPDIAIACLEAGAEMIGLVHYPPSPRHIDVAQMREILDAVEQSELFHQTVLVVVDQLPEEIDPRINYLQVYGHIEPAKLQRDDIPPCRIQVIKDDETIVQLCNLCVANPHDTGLTFESLYFGHMPQPAGCSCQCRNASTYYCLEVSQGALPGGNGAAWDWSIARPFCERYPTLIAGGITPENVAEVIRQANPFGIDVSSGVESSPGVKDIDKVKRLIENVHQAIIGN